MDDERRLEPPPWLGGADDAEDLFETDRARAEPVFGPGELFDADERFAEPPHGARSRRRGLRGETARRVYWALPWIVFAIFIVAVGGLTFTLAVAGLGLIGLREFFLMTREANPLAPAAFVTVVGVVLAAHFGSAFNVLLIASAGFALMFLSALDRRRRQGITMAMGVTVLGAAWVGIPLVHAVLLRDLPLHGGALLIDVLVGTFVTDTAAYGAGRLFGQHRITPRLSPNKTLEGLIGGFLAGTMAVWFAGLYQDWLSGVDALLLGAGVAALGPLGDLFESMIKRDLGVKDTGTVFGPHGGLLDRLDAVFFTVVAGYYLSVALVY
jgi:phosphatidate cytidylyltransferase